MSAFFVGKETIDAVATLILMADGPRSLADLTKVAKSCWMMNALALEQRYASQSANDFLEVIKEVVLLFRPVCSLAKVDQGFISGC